MSALAKDLLTPEQLALVRKRSDLRGTWLVFHAWAVIFGAMAVFVAFPNPLTYILAVMVIGARQLGLAILMHDGAHGILTENQKLNSFLSQWFCAYPMMAETGAYRRYHLKHHANTRQPEDPDLIRVGRHQLDRGIPELPRPRHGHKPNQRGAHHQPDRTHHSHLR